MNLNLIIVTNKSLISPKQDRVSEHEFGIPLVFRQIQNATLYSHKRSLMFIRKCWPANPSRSLRKVWRTVSPPHLCRSFGRCVVGDVFGGCFWGEDGDLRMKPPNDG